MGILVSIYVLARLLWTLSGDGTGHASLYSSVLVCVFLGVVGEVFLRVILVQKPDGAYVGHIRVPYFWQEFVDRTRIRWARSNDQSRFSLYDPLLGWAIGPGRVKDHGKYVSSARGIEGCLSRGGAA